MRTLNHSKSLRDHLHGLFRSDARRSRTILRPKSPLSRNGIPSLPNLPPELWGLIIREATTTAPDPLDVTQGVSFLESPHCKVRDYRSTMQNKRNLCLVSRLWNALAREYLYEFVWICRSRQARALALTLLLEDPTCDVRGRYIRRLHIETPALDRCSPSDVRTILDYAPNLVVYSDYRSVRRGRSAPACDPRSSSEELFSALTHPNNSLRRLSWTNYDTDVAFNLHLSPMLETTVANLEYLELTVCSPHFPSLFSDIVSSNLPSASSVTGSRITLPALRSLKVTLDNATFAMLSTWSFPQLTNISVVSADFSYAAAGFSDFFRVHGPKILQLELGHSSSMIEEHYLTAPAGQTPAIPLNEYCPNLKEFVCSVDAEWNWMSPDWIAPHVLLPSHPTLELIGIKDIDKRLIDDAEVFASPNHSLDEFFLLTTQLSSLLNGNAFPSLRYIRDLSYESHVMRLVAPRERVTRFWMGVLGMCKERQVWLEDYKGWNVTSRDLQRASMGVNGGWASSTAAY